MIFDSRNGLLEVSPDLEGPPLLCLDAAEVDANAVALDVLARLALTARRCGYRIALRDASPELVELIEFAGLTQALPQAPVRSGSTPPRC